MAGLIHKKGNKDEPGAKTGLSEDDFPSAEPVIDTNVTHVPSRDWQIGCNLNKCLLNIYNNDRWTDMIIRCGDNADSRTLKAHKIILAARSPVFEAMLFGPCSDGKTEYNFPDADVDIFDMMLRFVYNDDAKLTSVEDAIDLMKLAHMYQIGYLVDNCSQFLQSHRRVANVCKTLDCAMKYGTPALLGECCDFADRHAGEVAQTDGFLNLSKEGLIYLLKGDTFVADEDVIFNRVEEWAKLSLAELGQEENGQRIRDVLGDAFYHVRLPTLPAVKLMECIEQKGYFSVNEYEGIMNCCLKRQSQLCFVSNVERVPIEEKLSMSSHTDSIMNEANIDQIIEIKVDKDLHLTSVEIPSIRLFMKYDDHVYDGRNSYAKRVKGQILPKCLNLLLLAIITIDEINFKYQRELVKISDDDYNVVFYDNPVLLKKRELPYELRIQIAPIREDVSDVLLEVSNGIVWASSESNIVTVSQPNESNIGVNAIGIRHCSFRGDTEHSKLKKRKWETAFCD